MRDVDGAWSKGNKKGETVDRQPASNRPGGSNVPDAGKSGNLKCHFYLQTTKLGVGDSNQIANCKKCYLLKVRFLKNVDIYRNTFNS